MSSFLTRIDRLDEQLDGFFEPIRNSRPLVYVFNTASAVGDSAPSGTSSGSSARSTAPSRGPAVAPPLLMGGRACFSIRASSGCSGANALSVAGDDRFTVRRPLTSSFPSGHASSTFFAAVVLSGWVGATQTFVIFVVAVIIALSRVVVRIHHVSDILVGSVVGALLGTIAVQFTATIT